MASQEEKSYVAPVVDEQGAIELMERQDENQIVEAMKGAVVDKLYYEIERFDSKKGEMVKSAVLSWAGVKWFTLRLGKITVEEVRLTETEDRYRAIAWARDKARDVRVMGAAEQSKKTERKGKIEVDEFALAKVVSKAQRNALRNLIPETLISEALVAWKEGTEPRAVAEPTTVDSRAFQGASPADATTLDAELREFVGMYKVDDMGETLSVSLTKNFGSEEFRKFREKVERLGGKYVYKDGKRTFEVPK